MLRNISTTLSPGSSAYNVKPASRWPYWSTKMPVSTANSVTIHARPQPRRNMVIYQQVPIYASVLVDTLLLQQHKIKWEFLCGGRGLWERGGGTLINASHPTFIVFHTRPSPSSLRKCILEKDIYIYTHLHVWIYLLMLQLFMFLCSWVCAFGFVREIVVFVAFGEFFVSLLVLHLNQKDVPSPVTL